MTKNAAFQPNATANGGMISGVRIAPILGAVLITPSAWLRCTGVMYSVAAFTPAGVLTVSPIPSTTRAPTNCDTVLATACAIPARLQTSTASP